jgi:hypothetical protein
MTTPNPQSEKQNLPAPPDSEETPPNPADATGFFNRVRREFNPEEKPVHPSEAAEIVIMEEDSK